MNPTEFKRVVRALTGVDDDEAALEAVRVLCERGLQSQQPGGVVLVLDPNLSGLYWSHIFGFPEMPSSQVLRLLQGAAEHFARVQLEPAIRGLERREIEQQVRERIEKGHERGDPGAAGAG